LLKARDIVLRRDAPRLAQAEYYVELVKTRLMRATESESAAKKYKWPILGWGLLWCVVYLAALILLGQDWVQNYIAPSGGANSFLDMVVLLSAMVWGGIGGVVAVLYSLFKHVGQRDFDTQYNLSYVGKPFLGLVLGATAYIVSYLAIKLLGILPGGPEGVGGPTAPGVAPGVIYLVAWASGFKENRIFDLVDRVMKRIFSGEGATTHATAGGPPQVSG
jgi:hypothetical protein